MIWIFVTIGMLSFASALHGVLTAVEGDLRDLTSRLFHFVAILLLTTAWTVGHDSGVGWAALSLAAAMEVGLRIRSRAIERKLAEEQAARDALAATSNTTDVSQVHEPAPIRAATVRERVPESPPPPPPFVTVVLLREPHQVMGDVFVASLRRSGRRDAEVIAPPRGSAAIAASAASWQARIGEFTLEVTNQRSPIDAKLLSEAVGQSFDWPDAMDACRGHASCVRIITRAATQTPRSHVVAMHRLAHTAIAEFAPVCGVLWEAAQLLRPVAVTSEDENTNHMETSVNFRVTPADSSPATMVSDTVGLHAFGLPDIEIATPGEPDERISAVLYHLAETFFAHGCDWQDGDEREVGQWGRWRCERRRSAIAPGREVLAMRVVVANAI